MIKMIFIGLIRVYQWTISPLIGNNCRFTPTCSEYAAQALSKHGFFKGSWLAIKRILRCNPWHSNCGSDPVP